jgi:hypothetical protein
MRGFAIVAAVVGTAFFGATSSVAQSALERVLTMIAENPELAGETIFLNLASHGASGARTVDSSVHLVQKQDQKGDAPPAPLELQIETLAMGATNIGLVKAITPTVALTDGVVTTFAASNAATTQSPILAPIDILSNAPISDASHLSTRAIGSVNTGVVQIVVKPGVGE